MQFDFGVVVSLTFTPYLIMFIFEHFPIESNKKNMCVSGFMLKKIG